MEPTKLQKKMLAECAKLPRTNVLWKLADLHKQATVERSHYYTGRVILEAITEIVSLRTSADNL